MGKSRLLICLLFIAGNAFSLDFDKLYNSWSDNLNVSHGTYSAEKGAKLWGYEMFPGKSCSSCHGDDLTKSGRHTKTNKVIKPLSPSANPNRLTKEKKINKWLKRNCKFTYKRTCTAEEKINFIEFIKNN